MNHCIENAVLKQKIFKMLSTRLEIIILNIENWTVRHFSDITEPWFIPLLQTYDYNGSWIWRTWNEDSWANNKNGPIAT